MRMVSFRLDDETIEYIDELSQISGHTRSEIIRRSILNQKINFSEKKRIKMYMKTLYEVEKAKNIMMNIFYSLDNYNAMILSDKFEEVIVLLTRIENDL